MHGGLINVNPEFGHPAGGGWPDFIVWPRFTTLVHQQAYIDWLYRAYQGGLRLVTLPGREQRAARHPQQTRNAADRRPQRHRAPGGGHEGDGRLRRSAGRRAGQGLDADRLLGRRGARDHRPKTSWPSCWASRSTRWATGAGWRTCRSCASGDLEQARQLIGEELDWLYGLGIRQITPIHLTNNAFGGTAIYMRFLDVGERVRHRPPLRGGGRLGHRHPLPHGPRRRRRGGRRRARGGVAGRVAVAGRRR